MFNSLFLTLLPSFSFTSGVYKKQGRATGGRWGDRKCTTLKVRMLCPLVLLIKIGQKKEHWKWKSWGDLKWNVGASSRENYLSIWSKFRILFRGLDYEDIVRNLWGWVWAKILNLLLERMPWRTGSNKFLKHELLPYITLPASIIKPSS